MNPYVGVGLGLNYVDFGKDDDSWSQFHFFSAVGVKMPVAGPLLVRLEGRFTRAFEKEDDHVPAVSQISAIVGFVFVVK